ncbi:TAXI family TRAP transporter solute-binding subunit [Auritidibacter ignavus]|uniref:TAXI family TRAP transporter solute-binding subunit n=1 Tax=Auritidibacter ignavus TaxID=678932 RepID=UPI0024487CB4|nr:TAXI family TRAP transporter solute-binding subunit [Auritidibacter ignavus]WGH83237.1 TAXI family TRAP transporter solute-binding subunit [Auritidibacter ignavus]
MKAFTSLKVVAATAVAALALTACGDEGGNGGGGDAEYTQDITFATGSSSGVYFPLGNEYANVIGQNTDLSLDAIETDGSADNIGRINNGSAQLGFSQNNTAQEAISGTGQFEGAEGGIENVAWIGQLYPEAAQVITLEGNGIDTISDLEGKRVGIGAPGSGTRAVALEILEAYGLEEGDYEAYEEGFTEGRSLLQDGHIDASIEILGVPAASLQELSSTNDVKLVSLDQEEADAIAGDTLFETYTIEAGTYDFVEDDVLTVTVYAALLGSTSQISEDDAYELTKTIYENADDISLPQADLINAEDGLLGVGDIPVHPGAQKYFDEVGASANGGDGGDDADEDGADEE